MPTPARPYRIEDVEERDGNIDAGRCTFVVHRPRRWIIAAKQRPLDTLFGTGRAAVALIVATKRMSRPSFRRRRIFAVARAVVADHKICQALSAPRAKAFHAGWDERKADMQDEEEADIRELASIVETKAHVQQTGARRAVFTWYGVHDRRSTRTANKWGGALFPIRRADSEQGQPITRLLGAACTEVAVLFPPVIGCEVQLSWAKKQNGLTAMNWQESKISWLWQEEWIRRKVVASLKYFFHRENFM